MFIIMMILLYLYFYWVWEDVYWKYLGYIVLGVAALVALKALPQLTTVDAEDAVECMVESGVYYKGSVSVSKYNMSYYRVDSETHTYLCEYISNRQHGTWPK